jgi:acyl dehydratase
MPEGRTLDQIADGEVFEHHFVVTDKMIVTFAEATGDNNPLHLDEKYAAGTVFKQRVAHGMLSAGILSGVLGTKFPGVGTIYMSQTLQFRRPVFIGDQLTLRLTVLEKIPAKNRLRIETVCFNQHGEEVLIGEALVMPPS